MLISLRHLCDPSNGRRSAGSDLRILVRKAQRQLRGTAGGQRPHLAQRLRSLLPHPCGAIPEPWAPCGHGLST